MSGVVAGFALVAGVLLLAGLTSGIVQRAPISFPIIFLGLGFILGEYGLGVLSLGPEDVRLEAVATLTLALVLSLEGINIGSERGTGGAGVIPILSLGPGTAVIIAVVSAGAYFLLDTTVVQSLLLGTILASTDPVILRDVVQDERIPRPIRQSLNIEAGTNDIVILPTLLLLIEVARPGTPGAAGWALFVVQVLLLGPIIGFAIGAGTAWLINKVNERYDVSPAYQALYGIGALLLAFSSAEALGGDGFLAAFAAGFAVATLNFGLIQSFVEYGDTTSEMAMLLSFVLFGTVISGLFTEAPLVPALILAAVVIFVARPLAIGIVLRRARVDTAARMFIGWFGPRGLNSLLLALLVVQAGVAGSEFLLAVVGIVVTASVMFHGVSATPVSTRYGRASEKAVQQE